jgi:hypothetical protein
MGDWGLSSRTIDGLEVVESGGRRHGAELRGIWRERWREKELGASEG